jgi:hypothetical protein
MRSIATWRSSGVNNHRVDPVVDEGKSGRTITAGKPNRKLAEPSRLKSHRHPAMPCTPSKPANMPAVSRPKNAVARTRQE